MVPVTATQTNPISPPSPKQTALSCSGGTGAVRTVKSANSAHNSTAPKPVTVAQPLVMLSPT